MQEKIREENKIYNKKAMKNISYHNIIYNYRQAALKEKKKTVEKAF